MGEQEQRLQDMKLEREEDRVRKRRQTEVETKEHERKLQRAAHEAKQQELETDRKARIKYYEHLQQGLGLSAEQLSSYLISSEQGPPGKLVQIVAKDSGSGSNSFIIQDGV